MNAGPGPGKQQGGGAAGRHRRRRGRRHGKQQQQQNGQSKGSNSRHNPDGIYTAPMDHSYRASQGNGNGAAHRNGRPGFSSTVPLPDPEPLPELRADATARIFAFVDDLFFMAKIQETARKLNVKVEFLKTDKDLTERVERMNGDEKPSLIIFDLNSVTSKPLALIPKLKTRFKKATSIVGYLSHVQGDLKLKAQEAGCDMVVPRSAFSQNLPQLLRRHGAVDVPEDEGRQPQHVSIQ